MLCTSSLPAWRGSSKKSNGRCGHSGETDAAKVTGRVPGRNETKTYGKSEVVRQHKQQPTLPRKGLFEKVLDERWRLFNDLCIPYTPIEIRFSGKLPYTTLDVRAERLTVGSAPLARIPAYKYLK